MYDTGKVIAGLVIFAGFFTYPLWHNAVYSMWGDRVVLEEGQPAILFYELEEDAEVVTAKIFDRDNKEVATLVFGPDIKAGPNSIHWNGLGDDGVLRQPDSYRYEIEAVDTNGNPIEADTGRGVQQPAPRTPPNMTNCVEDTEWMRRNHMGLLDDWRNQVVREGNRERITVEGRIVERSLTEGCGSCHTNRAEFCTECHTYVGVDPYCWECHILPEERR